MSSQPLLKQFETSLKKLSKPSAAASAMERFATRAEVQQVAFDVMFNDFAAGVKEEVPVRRVTTRAMKRKVAEVF